MLVDLDFDPAEVARGVTFPRIILRTCDGLVGDQWKFWLAWYGDALDVKRYGADEAQLQQQLRAQLGAKAFRLGCLAAGAHVVATEFGSSVTPGSLGHPSPMTARANAWARSHPESTLD